VKGFKSPCIPLFQRGKKKKEGVNAPLGLSCSWGGRVESYGINSRRTEGGFGWEKIHMGEWREVGENKKRDISISLSL